MKLIPNQEPEYQSLLAQETLILEATETIIALMRDQGISRIELAKRLGRSKAFVSQVLAGDRNMTLRTLADLAYALDCTLRMTPEAIELVGVETCSSETSQPRSEDSPTGGERATPEKTDSHEYALAA